MASNLEIANELEDLAIHCRLPIMDIDGRTRWMRTWCEDLAEFPLSAIRSACKTWRQGESTKFPTPGQLLPMVRRSVPSAPGTGQPPENKPWTWPSEDELEAMTLKERRRQYLIMASETRSKVGPMNDKGEYPRPEFLRQAHEYLDRAKHCEDLIRRGIDRMAAE